MAGMDLTEAPDPEEVLLLAADGARLVLENGGETYRAEETATALATGLGAVESECFATPTGIVLSMAGADGRTRTVVRRVSKRSLDLDRITRLDALARQVVAGRQGLAEAATSLGAIETSAEGSLPLALAAAAAGTGFFALFFGGGWREALAAAVIGALLSRLTRALSRRNISDFFTNLAGGALIVLAAVAAKRLGLIGSSDKTIIGAAMYLVPGVAITNAIRDTIAGDLVAGVARGADAFMAAAAISIGAGGAFEVWKALGAGSPSGPALAAVSGGALWAALAPIVWTVLATTGFSLRFGLRGKDLLPAGAGAMAGWIVYVAVEGAVGPNPGYFAAALVIGLWAEVLAAFRRKPATIYIVTAIFPLVPGGGMYYTMLHSVRGDLWAAILSGYQTLGAAGAIAAGLAVSSALSRLASLRSLARRFEALPRRGPRLGPSLPTRNDASERTEFESRFENLFEGGGGSGRGWHD